MARFLALVLLLALPASAQVPTPAPSGCPDADRDGRCDDEAKEPTPASDPGSTAPLLDLRGSSGGSSGSSSAGSLSGLDGEAALALLVVGAALAPLIVYAADDDASAEVRERWAGSSMRLDVWANAQWEPKARRREGAVGVRAQAAWGWLGVDAAAESSVDFESQRDLQAHLLLVPPPRAHIEGALALGAREVRVGPDLRRGADIALPHRYVFRRDGRRQLDLEVRPSMFIGEEGFDFALTAALEVPLADLACLRLGGKAFSFDERVALAAEGGVGMRF